MGEKPVTTDSTPSDPATRLSASSQNVSPNPGPSRRSRWSWASGQQSIRQERVPGVASAAFTLSTLVKNQLLDLSLLKGFQASTGLADFAWRTIYHTGVKATQLTLKDRIARARGFIIFMHGWDGCGEIWENLPALLCQKDPHLVCFTLDVNGFGNSPFLDPVPAVEQCDPFASMRAVEHWASLIHLTSTAAQARRVPFVFVGHSMSGASLFYKSDTSGWEHERYGLLALAPALLRGDVLRRGFYKALGVGIIAGTDQGIFDWLKAKLSPRFIEPLIGGASVTNKKLHLEIFARTAKGTVAQTFYAMGMAEREPQRLHWNNFRVILGHHDRMVGTGPMLSLLEELGLSSTNVRVVFGDHYFFSAGRGSPPNHAKNREIVVEEILTLFKAVSK